MLITESVIETLAVDTHLIDSFLDGGCFIAARPEDLHCLMERLVPVEFFVPRHPTSASGSLLYAFWNAQSRIDECCAEMLEVSGRLGTSANFRIPCSSIERVTVPL